MTAADSAFFNADEVIALYLSVKPEYRKNGMWLMNDETALLLRTPYMPNIGASTMPIAFGDLSYYWILIRQPLSVKVLTELYVHEGVTGYAAHERLDGMLIRPEAVKTIKMP